MKAPWLREPCLHYHFPTYFSNKKLSTAVKTREWTTLPFEIKRGMLEGDTLSPVIFLTVFNPLVELSNCLPTCGFSLEVPVNSAIYVYWDESLSEEPTGWYHAVVKSHLPDCTNAIEYVDKATETVNLHSIKWEPTGKGQKAYLDPQ